MRNPGRALLRVARTTETRVVLSMGAQAVAASLFALLTARWLGPSSRGSLVVFMTTSSFLMLLGSLGVSTGARVLLNASPPLRLTEYLVHARFLSMLHVITAGSLGLVVLATTGGMPTPWIGVVFVPVAVLQLFSYFQREALHGLGRHGTALYGDVLASAVQTAAIVLLELTDRLSLVPVALVVLGGSLAQAGYLATRLRAARQSPPFGTYSLKALIRYSLPALVTTLGQAFVIRGDRLVLGLLAGAAPVGIYGAAATITEVLWLIPLGVAQVAFRRASLAGIDRAGARARNLTLLVTVLAGAALAACTHLLVAILLGPKYAGAVGLVYILIAASVPMASYQLDAAVLNGIGRLSEVGPATMLGAAVLVVGCLGTIPTFGAFGAAWSSVAAYSAMAVVARFRVRRLSPAEG